MTDVRLFVPVKHSICVVVAAVLETQHVLWSCRRETLMQISKTLSRRLKNSGLQHFFETLNAASVVLAHIDLKNQIPVIVVSLTPFTKEVILSPLSVCF